jgi:hypothetical protein
MNRHPEDAFHQSPFFWTRGVMLQRLQSIPCEAFDIHRHVVSEVDLILFGTCAPDAPIAHVAQLRFRGAPETTRAFLWSSNLAVWHLISRASFASSQGID